MYYLKKYSILFTILLILPGVVNAQPALPEDSLPSNLPAKLMEQARKLYDGNVEERYHAAVVIGEYKEKAEPLIPFLATMFDDGIDLTWPWQSFESFNAPARGAAEALATIGKAAVPALKKNLENKECIYRFYALHAFSKMKDQNFDDIYIKALSDKNHLVRLKAVKILGEIGNEEHFSQVVRMLSDKNLWVRRLAIKALGNFEKLPEPSFLMVFLNHEDKVIRGWAAVALGELKEHRAIPMLVKLLADKEMFVQNRAFQALVNIGPEAVPILNNTVVESKNVYQKRLAVAVLNVLAHNSSIKPLTIALKDKDSYVRANAIRALTTLHVSKVVPQFIALLSDRDSGVRMDAAEGLYRLGWRPDTASERAIYYIALQEWAEVEKLGIAAEASIRGYSEDGDLGVRKAIKRILRNLEQESLAKEEDRLLFHAMRSAQPGYLPR